MKIFNKYKITIFVSLFFLLGCETIVIAALNSTALTKIAIQGDKLYLMSLFNSKSYDEITTVIDKNPQLKTIVLTANEGSIDDDITFELARYIRKKGLNTHLLSNSVIASGAVDLFLSGVKRSIEKGAKLGVHSWSDGSKEAKDFPRDHEEHKLNADYIRDMLGNDEFYWFTIYAADADNIYWMNESEIKKYKLITDKNFLKASKDKTPFGQEFIETRTEMLED